MSALSEEEDALRREETKVLSLRKIRYSQITTYAHLQGLDCGYNQNRKPGLQPGYVAQLQTRIGKWTCIPSDIGLAELEALVEEQSLALQRAEISRRSSVISLDERYLTVDRRDGAYLNLAAPQSRCPSYAHTLHLPLPSTNLAPSIRRNSQDISTPINDQSPKSNGLNHLLHAAMSSPPEKENRKSVQESRRGSEISCPPTPVSFPTFPHNIFNNAEHNNSPTEEVTKTPLRIDGSCRTIQPRPNVQRILQKEALKAS